ncbi:MAG: signal peptidase I [Actinobacteria bacterium]|nr:signal peptidase I [Actinomycetota bacterium]
MSGSTAAVILFAVAIISVLHIIGMWKVLVKGGEPGAFSLLNLITCLIPVSFIPIMRMIGRPTWWVVLLYIPIVNLVVILIVSIELSRSFGKGTGFGIGLWILAPIFYIILGFGSSTYRGPVVTQSSAA